MMPYWLRITLGVLLGLAAAVGLWLLVGIAWLTATGAALAAAIGFLGSYFVWSADRPEEGYEQVLFDRPNTLVASALIVAFALAGVGTGLLGGSDAAAPPTPESRLRALSADYQRVSDAYARDEADADATTAALADLRAESDRLGPELEALPESPARAALVEANGHLAGAMDALGACVAGEEPQCLEARLLAADAASALARAEEEAPADDEPAALEA